MALFPVLEAYSVREARIHVRRLRDLMSTSFESNANSAADNLSHSFSVAVSGVEVEGKERNIFSSCEVISLSRKMV
jgi:hypothetical protein